MAGHIGICGVDIASCLQNLRGLWVEVKYPRTGLVSTNRNSFEISKLTSGGVSADNVNVGSGMDMSFCGEKKNSGEC